MTEDPSAKFAETLTLQVEDLARGGAGVARDASGRVIFVPLTAPGDRVRVEITHLHKNYAQGRLLEVLEPSPKRVPPRCPVYTRCGGCQWQHLPYELQWATKSQGVLHALKRTQVEPPRQFDEVPARDPWNYRNRIQLRGLGPQLGFFEPGSRTLVPTDHCEIARPELNQAWELTRQEGSSRFREMYKVEVEVLPTGEIRKTWNSAHGAAGFRQVNDEQNQRLQDWVAQAITPRRTLVDLFGGSGNLSARLAPQMTITHCVDSFAPQVAPPGTPEKMKFHRMSVLSWLLRNKIPLTPASAILDPPREGLGKEVAEIIASIERLGIDEVVAVGCDPDSWARDLKRFVDRGWIFVRGATIDLFPHTPHIESVGLLRRSVR